MSKLVDTSMLTLDILCVFLNGRISIQHADAKNCPGRRVERTTLLQKQRAHTEHALLSELMRSTLRCQAKKEKSAAWITSMILELLSSSLGTMLLKPPSLYNASTDELQISEIIRKVLEASLHVGIIMA